MRTCNNFDGSCVITYDRQSTRLGQKNVVLASRMFFCFWSYDRIIVNTIVSLQKRSYLCKNYNCKLLYNIDLSVFNFFENHFETKRSGYKRLHVCSRRKFASIFEFEKMRKWENVYDKNMKDETEKINCVKIENDCAE